MFKKLLLSFVVVILLLIGFVVGYWLLVEDREMKQGENQNSVLYSLENIKEPLDVMFVGDSLSAGFLGNKGAMSVEDLGYRDNVMSALNDVGMLGSSVNYAVGGYKTTDVLSQIENDVNLYDVNEKLRLDGDDSQQFLAMYPQDESLKEINFSSSVLASDVMFVTLGANDVLDHISLSSDAVEINFDSLIPAIKSVNDNKVKIYEAVRAINPDIKIIDIGMYFAYPHIGDEMVSKLYPILAIAEGTLFMDDPKNNIYNVELRDNIQVDPKVYVPNPNDIHPGSAGYDVMSNEILKVLNESYE